MESTPQNRFNTSREDITTFQAERIKFTEYVSHFKSGNPNYCLPSLNSMETMYLELMYGEHYEVAPEEAQDFLARINILRKKMTMFLCVPHPEGYDKDGRPKLRYFLNNHSFMEMVDMFTVLYAELKIIKKKMRFG